MYPSGVPLWECERCHSRMLHMYRQTHVCPCPGCGENLCGSDAHDCTPDATAEREAAKAQAELRDDNVAALLHEWGVDATKGLPEDQQDAHVTVTAQRAFAEWLREHGR